MGIAPGLGIPAPMVAGAIISGAYFGDKMSPLSDTTNLAPAMAGTGVFTHVKFIIFPTATTYISGDSQQGRRQSDKKAQAKKMHSATHA